MKKKVLALLTVLVMVLSIVAVPNVSAQAADETSGEVTFLNGNLANQAGEITIFAHAYGPDVNWQSGYAGNYGWWDAMLLAFDPATGIWTVTQSHTPQGATNSVLETGKIGYDAETGVITVLIICHATAGDDAAKKASYDFFTANNQVGKQFYLVGDLMGTVVDENYAPKEGAITGLTFTTVEPADYFGKPAATPDPEPTPTPTPTPDEPGDDITPTGDFDTMATTALMMVSVALVGVVLVLKKRNNVA